jgi:hypothetical protein
MPTNVSAKADIVRVSILAIVLLMRFARRQINLYSSKATTFPRRISDKPNTLFAMPHATAQRFVLFIRNQEVHGRMDGPISTN